MGFRIQPKDIEIPDDDPFKNDRLGRKEPAQILTRILKSVDGPCVLAVDAPWGAGKTTFLGMLARHLRNCEFPVVEFNAWETDFTSDPFLALSEELTIGVREYTDGPLRGEIDKVKAAAKEVVRLAVPGAIRLATAGLLDFSPFVEKEAGQALASIAKKRLSEYLDARTTLRTFRASLGEFATRLTESKRGLPLIVVKVMRGRLPGLSGHHAALLEAVLIVSAVEIAHPDRYVRDVRPSPFLAEYRGAAQQATESADHDDAEALRATSVVRMVDSFVREQLHHGVGLGFLEAARRLDLVSPRSSTTTTSSGRRAPGPLRGCRAPRSGRTWAAHEGARSGQAARPQPLGSRAVGATEGPGAATGTRRRREVQDLHRRPSGRAGVALRVGWRRPRRSPRPGIRAVTTRGSLFMDRSRRHLAAGVRPVSPVGRRPPAPGVESPRRARRDAPAGAESRRQAWRSG